MLHARIQEVRRTKKVGLLINANSHLFSNGIIQNAYFIYQCLESLGMTCQFLCHEENPGKFGYKDYDLKQISTNPLVFDPNEYHTIMAITRGISKELYDILKAHKIAVVGFTCGNTMMHDIEDFLRGPFFKGQSTHVGKGSPTDEQWVIPSYRHALDYISVVRGRPALVVPHLWSPCILREFAAKHYNKTEDDLYYNYANHTGTQIDALIMEPNLAVFKDAWIPIVGCEKYYLDHRDGVDNVYVFNYPENTHAYSMADNLQLEMDKKLRKFKRLTIAEVFSHFNTKSTFPVIVSHQILNGLNYLYYEALYYGWPLVHNSKDMEDCGYYYPENDIAACAATIRRAYTEHNRNVESYKEKARKFLERVDPLHPSVTKIWDQLFNATLAKNLAV